jgi:nitrogen fixation protein FixH
MRVRPFFWIFLATVCAGVLIFAAAISIYRLVPMVAHIEQVSTVATNHMIVRLSLTDPEGMPIDQAQVIPRTSMPAMRMGPQQIAIQPLGHGIYLTQISFSMLGAWKIDIIARADGFAPAHRSILVNIV